MAIVRLGDLCEIIPGKKPNKDLHKYITKNKNDGFNWIKQRNLENFNVLLKTSSYFKKEFISMTRYTSGKNIYFFPDCDIKAFESKIDFCYDGHTWELINNEKILKKFLLYSINKNIDNLKKQQVGTTLKFITRPIFENFKIYIPNINDQQKIIDIIEPKEYLYKKYSNLINIDNYDSFIKSWNILIDIIEPFEIMWNFINKKLNKMNSFLINIYIQLKTKNKIEFNKLCHICSKKYDNQKFYVDTSCVKTSIIKQPTYLEKKKSRSNLTVVLNSIIFSKLKGENKVYPIFKDTLLKNVYSTGFINIISNYSAYIYGFFLSNDFINLKNNNSVGTLMEGVNNTIVNSWNINDLNYKKWNKNLDLSLILINYYNELIIKIDNIIKLLLSLYIS